MRGGWKPLWSPLSSFIRFSLNTVLGHISAIIFHYSRHFSCLELYIESVSINSNCWCGAWAAIYTQKNIITTSLWQITWSGGHGLHYHNQWAGSLGKTEGLEHVRYPNPTGRRKVLFWLLSIHPNYFSLELNRFAQKSLQGGLCNCPEKHNQYRTWMDGWMSVQNQSKITQDKSITQRGPKWSMVPPARNASGKRHLSLSNAGSKLVSLLYEVWSEEAHCR